MATPHESPDLDLLRLFVTESLEHLDAIEPLLLDLVKLTGEARHDAIDGMFRAVHNIKGCSGFFGMTRLSLLSHTIESLLVRLRDGSIAPEPAVLDAVLDAMDRVRALVIHSQHEHTIDIDADIDRLSAILGADACRIGPNLGCLEGNVPRCLARHLGRQQRALDAVGIGGDTCYDIRLQPDDLHAHGQSLADVVQRLEQLGRLLTPLDNPACLRRNASLAPVYHGLFVSPLEPDELAHALTVPAQRFQPIDVDLIRAGMLPLHGADGRAPPPDTVRLVAQYDLAGDQSAVEPPSAADARPGTGPTNNAKADSGTRAFSEARPASTSLGAPSSESDRTEQTSSLRVRTDLLGQLVNLAGELVLGRNRLHAVLAPHVDAIAGLNDLLTRLDQITADLQDGILRTRMQPVRSLFQRVRRQVRDLSKRLGKPIDIELDGEDVELDKSILEALADPLTHLVRNAADHGLESPDERRAAGKAPAGIIRLQAVHDRGQVTIAVGDDGRGLDRETVAAKAVAMGLLSQGMAATLTDQELLRVISRPSFSTAATTTDVSGRGVGLDVVITNIERLGGRVELRSVPGAGTFFLLHLPLTLAIVQAIVVHRAGQVFALPQASVVELVWLRAGDQQQRLETIDGASVLHLRDTVLPLCDLADLLRLDPDHAAHGPTGERYVLVLHVNQHRFGVIVDAVGDIEETVVKSAPALIDPRQVYAGCSIRGDGRVVLILDPSGLVAQAGFHFTERYHEDDETDETGEQDYIICTAGASERFAVMQDQLLRLERLAAEQIRSMGPNRYVQHTDQAVPLVALDAVLPMSALDEAQGLHLLLPDAAARHDTAVIGGLLVHEVVDTVTSSGRPGPTRLLTGPGVLGEIIVDGASVPVIDVLAVVEAALSHTTGTRP